MLTKNGVGEKLLLEAGVPGVPDDEGPEDRSDPCSRSGNSNSGSSSSNELSSRVDISPCGGGLDGSDLGKGCLASNNPLLGQATGHGETGNSRHVDLMGVDVGLVKLMVLRLEIPVRICLVQERAASDLSSEWLG